MIVFRADGNAIIGMGHIMRCISIANQAKKMGHDCLFIIASGDCERIISAAGHSVKVIDSDYLNWRDGELDFVFDYCIPDMMIVDSYYINTEFMVGLHDKCKKNETKLVYIDDRCLEAYECDVLINYNVFASNMDYGSLYGNNGIPKMLMGTKYVPLRDEFSEKKRMELSKFGKNILISTGGADSEHLTSALLQVASEYKDFDFHVVVGMMNEDRDILKAEALNCRNIFIYENVDNMSELMLSCDLAISAAGSTLYELCAMQTPTITYVLADNQVPAAEMFDDEGVILNCGDIRKLGKDELAKKLIKEAAALARDYSKRQDIYEKMIRYVDDGGARRILEEAL